MKMFYVALILSIQSYSIHGSAKPKAPANENFRMLHDYPRNFSFNPLERELLQASCACNWPAFKKLVTRLPKDTTCKTVLLPKDQKTLQEFAQHTPDQDQIYPHGALGDIDKTSSIQGIVARRCAARFLQHAINRAGGVAEGSASMYMKNTMLNIYAVVTTFDWFNVKSLASIAALSPIQSQLKLSLIKSATNKSATKKK